MNLSATWVSCEHSVTSTLLEKLCDPTDPVSIVVHDISISLALLTSSASHHLHEKYTHTHSIILLLFQLHLCTPQIGWGPPTFKSMSSSCLVFSIFNHTSPSLNLSITSINLHKLHRYVSASFVHSYCHVIAQDSAAFSWPDSCSMHQDCCVKILTNEISSNSGHVTILIHQLLPSMSKIVAKHSNGLWWRGKKAWQQWE